MVLTCHSAYSYESSFPFPFEFGHSSDIYLNVKKPLPKKMEDLERANEILKQKKISKSPQDILKYIKQDDAEKIKLLLDAGMDSNGQIYVNTPVYYAAKNNSSNVLKVLLENGADPNKDMSSPLEEVIKAGNSECAKLLVENGADINYYNGISDESMLFLALKKGEYELAKMILEKGAKPDQKSYRIIKKKKLDEKYGIYVD